MPQEQALSRISSAYDSRAIPTKLLLQLLLSYAKANKHTIIFSMIGTTGIIYALVQLRKLNEARKLTAALNKMKLDRDNANYNSGFGGLGRRANLQHVLHASKKVGVNLRFVEQLTKLIPILIPTLDIWFSAFNGVVIKTVVTRDKGAFIKNAILIFGVMMWPMSIVNNLLKLLINSLSVSFRTRLTRFAHDKYLSNLVYYKVSNLDSRVQNADQLLTQDFEKFSENLAHLYSDLTKPIVDIILFAVKLGQAIGVEDIAQEQKLEGEFRYTHSRILTYAEEIGFYGGHEKEKENANLSYQKILDHLRKVFKYKFINGVFDSVLVKYFATMMAYYILSRPVFGSRHCPLRSTLTIQPKLCNLILKIVKPSRPFKGLMMLILATLIAGYLVNLSQAVGRLLLAGRELTRFAGFTSRVAEFFDVLEDVKEGHYEKTMISKDQQSRNKTHTLNQAALGGTIIEQDEIIDFKDVPIATPNGDILVPFLTFQIKKGMNCIITGPNGCGKSSLFRILGNLWPLYGGTVTKPHPSKLFYVPQKPYMPIGTIRDQVIYPNSKVHAIEQGFDDGALYELLKIVHLEYLVEREGGWDSLQDWSDVLSGGEKQRIAMARLFYHRPQFAILDECTSAVSVDVEGIMYTFARKVGITLITVSHRPSLFQYHEYLLKFDGQGGYEFKLLNEKDDPFDEMRAASAAASTELL